MVNIDREVGAVLLRRLRESRGWSWSDLARALRGTARQLAITALMHRQATSIQRTIARWESATDRTTPSERYQFLLAYIYARTPDGNLTLGPGSDFDTLMNAFRLFGMSPHRIQQIIKLVDESLTREGSEPWALLPSDPHSSVAAALRDPSRVNHELLSRLGDTVTTINGQVGSVPFVRLQLLMGPVVAICGRLLRPHQFDAPDELLLLATNAYALAARLAFETRDDETAMSLYVDATNAAGRLEDRSSLAAVRTSHTMVTLHATNGPEVARATARAATLDAHRGASYAVRARAHAVHAEVCARAGQADEAATALDRAWKTMDQLAIDDPHGGFNADRLNGFEGLCALHAGDAKRAHDRLDRSLGRLRQSRDAVQRGIVSSDLALARLRLGDPEACVQLLHHAVGIAAATGGRVPAQRIRQVRHELRPWRAEEFVAELDDHIHDSLIG